MARYGFCVWSRRAISAQVPPQSFPARARPRSRIKSGRGSPMLCETRPPQGPAAFAIIARSQRVPPFGGPDDKLRAEAIHSPSFGAMDCFAEPVIGRAFVRPVGSQ